MRKDGFETNKSPNSLLIQEPPLQVLPSLAVVIGLNEALVLQQLHYWLNNSKTGIVRNDTKWVFNSYNQWKENFPFWSKRTIQRIFLSLEQKGIVISKQFEKGRYDHRKYYQIDYDKLESLITPTCHNQERQGVAFDSANLAPSLNDSETTSETTSENDDDDEQKSPKVVTDPDYGKITTAWQNLHGILTQPDASFLGECLDDWRKHCNGLTPGHPDRDHDAADVVMAAIKITAGNAENQRSHAYTRQILKSWIENGYGWKPKKDKWPHGQKYSSKNTFLEKLKAA